MYIIGGDTQGADDYLTGVEQKLSDYAERCEKLGITFEVCVHIPDAMNVSDYELYVF